MRLEHHLVGGYVRYISPYIIIIIIIIIISFWGVFSFVSFSNKYKVASLGQQYIAFLWIQAWQGCDLTKVLKKPEKCVVGLNLLDV